jgi:hypothetical protein
MAERYTRADVARILVNINEQAGRLGMAGAGSYAVESMGGTYLYLTDRSRLDGGHSGPGSKLLDLGNSWHAAGVALLDLAQAWHVVEFQRSAAGDELARVKAERDRLARELELAREFYRGEVK